MRRAAFAVLAAACCSAPLFSQNTPYDRAGGAAQILTADDVAALLGTAAAALDNSTLAAAVVDRTGAILGVYARPQASDATPDLAVSVARAGALFANDQAPLSSRTVRFISGLHFPPGVRNTPNAALYGIESTNRGCAVDALGDAIVNVPIGRPTSIAGTFGPVMPMPCGPSDTRGCSPGIATGKADVLDSGPLAGAGEAASVEVPANPGGIPIYREGKVVGGIGVAGVAPQLAEYAATLAAAGTGRGLGFSEPLGEPGAVFIDGLRLPFFGACTSIPCIRNALTTRPAGAFAGRVTDGRFIVPARAGQQAPEGYLIGPRGSLVAGADALTEMDVRRIVSQSIEVALRTRAQIRLPISQPTRMIISVADEAGDILAAYRMPDATFFSLDVATTKARNAYYFSSRAGYDVLKRFVDTNQYARYSWEPAPPAGQGWAVTARTLSYGGQPLFPPGIDLSAPATPGPWFDLFVYDSLNACTEGPGATRGGDRSYVNQSGIVWFPGSAPLYKNGRLVGGMGVSGDGVEQDDYVSSVGSEGFHPPDALRADNSVIRDGSGREVRLPYLKFPRQPEFTK